MSILGQADPGATAGAAANGGQSPLMALILLALTSAGLVALGVFWWKGVFRRDGVVGPDRTRGPRAGWPVLVTLLVATTAWVGAQVALGTYKRMEWKKAGNAGEFSFSDLSTGDLAFLSTVPGLVGIAAAGLCLAWWPRDDRPRLGLASSQLPAGTLRGLAAFVLVLPLILWVSTGTETIYKILHFTHPGEHEMLKAMRESALPIRAALVVGAVLIAPVLEELLFRGLFQTLLVWAADNLFTGKARQATGRWVAILLTSVVFTVIHPLWMAPPIFVLAVCLGFVYERTGVLWATMAMHALFNGFETTIYLTGLAGS